MKKLLNIILISTILLLFLTGCGNGINKIKNAKLNDCSSYTIEELVNNYIENPEWVTEKSDDKEVYDVTGEAYYQNKLSDILIQFVIDGDDVTIEKFTVNNESKSFVDEWALVSDMCKTTTIMKEGTTEELANIPVQIIYNTERYTIEGDIPDTVDITVTGSKDNLEKIKQEEHNVTLDLSNYSSSDSKQRVYFTFGNNNDDLIYQINPSYVDIVIKDKTNDGTNNEEDDPHYISKALPIKIVPVGILATGKAIDTIDINIAEVVVYGNEEDIKDLTNIEVKIDVDGLSSDKQYEIAIDKPDGVKKINIDSIKVDVKIGDGLTKMLVVNDVQTTNLREGYIVQALSLPEFVITVTGSEKYLKNITEDDVSVYVDLEGYTTGEHEVSIQIKSSNPYVIFSPKPSTIVVKITEK